MPDLTTDPPFLDGEPPPWAARALTYVMLGVVAITFLGAFLVRVPETVTGRFQLVPERGTDPVRALREGVVSDVRARDGDTIEAGAPLFVIRSAPVLDRSADLLTLQTEQAATEQRLVIAGSQYETHRRADQAEARRLLDRAAYLERVTDARQRRYQLTRELADSANAGMARGAIGRLEASRLELEASTLGEDLQSARNDLAETRADLARLEQDTLARHLEYLELRRELEENVQTAGIRIDLLRRDPAALTGQGLVVKAPCTGTLLRLRVNAAGAVVREGETLAEIGCRGDRLQAELALPQEGVPLVHPGLGVKLKFDAFPYQRYGVRYGTIRWLGPAGMTERDSGAFRALVELQEDSIRVRGRWQVLLAGMGGAGDIVVGRRSLISYAVEPLRALRENFAEGPPR
jgi:multidrug efflux pump subunit AcrA (membrane-fusion protein)